MTTLIDALGCGSFWADGDGLLVRANEAAARILGYGSPAALLEARDLLRPVVDWPAVKSAGAPVRMRIGLVLQDRQRSIDLSVEAQGEGFAGLFLAADRESLSSDILERNRELEGVRRLANEALLAENRVQLQKNLLSICMAAVGADGGTLYLFDTAKKNLRIVAQAGMDPKFVEAVETLKLGEGFTGKVAVTRIPVLVDQLSKDPRTEFDVIRDLDLSNFASYPLVARNKLIGVLNLFTVGAGEFTANDVALLAALAAQASLALDHVTGMEELVARNDELERINRLAVDRELRMIELKKRIRELEAQIKLKR